MTYILVAIFFIAAFVLIFDFIRKQSSNRAPSSITENAVTADEALPTSTGRFRAQEMLKKTAKPEATVEGKPVDTVEVSTSPLPDPFSDKPQGNE